MANFMTDKKLPTVAGVRGVNQLHDDIDRLFGGFFGRDFLPEFFTRDEKALMPQIDFKSDDKAYTMSVELPGVAPEDVKVEVNGNELTVSGEKKEEVKENGKTHVQERRYGSFMRSMTLPEDADCDSIKAVTKNGVLSLEIPRKAPEQSKVRSIEVQKG